MIRSFIHRNSDILLVLGIYSGIFAIVVLIEIVLRLEYPL